MWTTCRQHRALSSEMAAGDGHQLVCELPDQVQRPGSALRSERQRAVISHSSRDVVASLKIGDVKLGTGYRSGREGELHSH
jgi:hypothetical protein